jgi:tetratricopeptide (TPR) repeat protein
MTKRESHHVPFGTLARVLPDFGSREAVLLLHVLRCDLCSQKALSILKPPPLPPQRPDFFDEIFARSLKNALESHAELTEERARSASFVAEILSLPDELAQEKRIRQLSRVEPWPVFSLLLVGDDDSERDPKRARTLARLALAGIEEAGLVSETALIVQTLCLLADVSRLAGEYAEAEAELTAATVYLPADADSALRASYLFSLAILRREQKRLDEAVALLDRAAALYDVAGDLPEAERALSESRAVQRRILPTQQIGLLPIVRLRRVLERARLGDVIERLETSLTRKGTT